MKIALGLAVLIATLGAASACTSGDSSAATLPTTPSPALTTESFSGTVAVLGNDVHTFTINQTGEVDITLTGTAPLTTISMGLAIGNPPAANSPVCLPVSGGTLSAQASATPQLTGTVAPGVYCVMVFDIGNETEPTTYTLTVKHP
jgi:hypothetical protein